MGPFEVTKAMIASLGDEGLRELLSRLLAAEARQREIPSASISVGGNQTAADGGVDASIEWKDGPEPTGWLPRRTILFQSKAETMNPAKIGKEMRPGGEARPIFRELAATGGSYIIFSTDDPSRLAEEQRIEAMRTAIADVDGKEAIDLHFYGAERIARWVRDHPGVALWVLEKAGHARAGWRSYGNWSAERAEARAYILDDAHRAIVDGEQVDIVAAVKAMRATLARAGGAVRLLGLSGVGKTRLAEVLFDERIEPASALPPARAIYGDAGLDLAISPALLAEQIAASGTEAVIVVDNCDDLVHGQLAEIVQRTGKASLLTIDYDDSGDKPEGLVVILGENSEGVLEALLEQRFPDLRAAERHRLSTFSGGNARVALKVAEAGDGHVDLSKLQDNELVDRLFRNGRQAGDPALRAAADAASLVTAFYVAEGRGYAPEHPVLAGIAEMSVAKFYANIATLLDWGVAQKRGPQRAVMPPPLANMLAAPAIRRRDPAVLIDQFASGPPRLFGSFARRIGQLHSEQAAIDIAERLFAPGGIFSEPADLDADRHQAFIDAAPASPEAMLAAIERSLAGPNRERLLAPTRKRKTLAETLVLIAHDAALFDRAIELLIAFARDDPPSGDNSVRPLLLERFWPVASFTLADLDTRMNMIDRMLDDRDLQIRELGVDALGHALSKGQSASSLRVQFGSRARDTEWRPPKNDFTGWFDTAHDKLLGVVRDDPSVAGRARAIFAKQFRAQLNAGFGDKVIAAMRAIKGDGYFEGGWRAANDALHFQRRPGRTRPAASEQTIRDLETLEREFRPRTLDELFETFVLGAPWRHWHPSGRQKRPQRNALRLSRAVGTCIGRSGFDPAPYLARTAAAAQDHSIWAFMLGLAAATGDPEPLWEQARAAAIAAPEKVRPALLGGLLEGTNRRHPEWVQAKLDGLVDDEMLDAHIVSLHQGVPLDGAAIDRFRKVLADGRIALHQFGNLALGGVSKPIPGPALADFLRTLFADDAGVEAVLDILQIRIFGDRSDESPVDPALIAFGREVLTDSRIYAGDRHEDFDVAEIGKAILAVDGSAGLSRGIAAAMRKAGEEGFIDDANHGELAQLLMARHPAEMLEEIAEKSDGNRLLARFLGPLALGDDDSDADTEDRLDELMKWVARDPQARALRLASVLRYAVTDRKTGQLRWSKAALAIIEASPEPRAVLERFEDRFSTGVGWGPFALRFVRRKPLAEYFLDHADGRLRAWGRAALRNLDRSIRHWDGLERERESLFE